MFIHNNSIRSNVISYLFFKAQACSGTEVAVDDAKVVQNYMPSVPTSGEDRERRAKGLGSSQARCLFTFQSPTSPLDHRTLC